MTMKGLEANIFYQEIVWLESSNPVMLSIVSWWAHWAENCSYKYCEDLTLACIISGVGDNNNIYCSDNVVMLTLRLYHTNNIQIHFYSSQYSMYYCNLVSSSSSWGNIHYSVSRLDYHPDQGRVARANYKITGWHLRCLKKVKLEGLNWSVGLPVVWGWLYVLVL